MVWTVVGEEEECQKDVVIAVVVGGVDVVVAGGAVVIEVIVAEQVVGVVGGVQVVEGCAEEMGADFGVDQEIVDEGGIVKVVEVGTVGDVVHASGL